MTATVQPQEMTATSIVGTTCMELALEGERLCKTGDFKSGVKYFEEAIKVGTNDQRTLSAIYSQLGNAYFYLEDYQRALDYHNKDVELVHEIGDEIAEAKACGNLGNTYKMLGKFNEAIVNCKRYLEISRKLHDEQGKARALYNLGNVYHTQGKRMIGTSEQEPGKLSNDIRSSLEEAIKYYKLNLDVVTQLSDFTSMGRSYGNLGNTYYLLGDFKEAVESHKKRLELAKQINDKSAERRAHLNLGNANVFLGNFQEAIENYSATMRLAQELQDRFTEAHSCYSLANTYTFLRDYQSAIKYHRKYLDMIKDFDDKLGEGRACWSLVNIYQMVNDPESALVFAKKHHEIAEALGDKAGLASAELNIEELEAIISQKRAAQMARGGGGGGPNMLSSRDTDLSIGGGCGANRTVKQHSADTLNGYRLTPDKRQEQEQRRFKKELNSTQAADIDGLAAQRRGGRGASGTSKNSSNERLFDMIARFQRERIDDQRCEILGSHLITGPKSRVADDKENFGSGAPSILPGKAGQQPGSHHHHQQRGSQPSINPMNAVSAAASAIKAYTNRRTSLVNYTSTMAAQSIQSQRRPTVSAEHRDQLFDLIAGAQRQRMDEQRASLPAFNLANGVHKNPTNAALLAKGKTIDHSFANPSVRHHQSDQIPEKPAIQANQTITDREKSSSNEDQPSMFTKTNITTNPTTTDTPPTIGSRPPKLSRRFQTVDSDVQVHDEKFLDSLMKYQSSRFDDQRSEFPNRGTENTGGGNTSVKVAGSAGAQDDNFFNLLVRFQSDRIDDQRSAPPTSNKNI